jgi:3-oxoacyl-(acyl-carrier-protein) synthase
MPLTPCRISYQFGLKGPSLSVDTACSSSLVATALARQSLTQPASAAAASGALVGGINIMLLPSTTAMFQRAGMLAPDGRCKALDAAADGYVRAEAAAMMLLGSGGDDSERHVVALLAGVCGVKSREHVISSEGKNLWVWLIVLSALLGSLNG